MNKYANFPILEVFRSCSVVDECFNEECYWKQKSKGYKPWYIPNKQLEEERIEFNSQFPLWKYPELKITSGTDAQYIHCESYQARNSAE